MGNTEPTDLRINVLVNRLNNLERANRILKLVVAALMVGLFAVSMRPTLPETIQKQLPFAAHIPAPYES